MAKSYKAEVLVQGDWSSNALRFATEKEARSYGLDLSMRWTLVADFRVTPCEDEVTHEWDDATGLGRIGEEKRFPAFRVQL